MKTLRVEWIPRKCREGVIFVFWKTVVFYSFLMKGYPLDKNINLQRGSNNVLLKSPLESDYPREGPNLGPAHSRCLTLCKLLAPCVPQFPHLLKADIAVLPHRAGVRAEQSNTFKILVVNTFKKETNPNISSTKYNENCFFKRKFCIFFNF